MSDISDHLTKEDLEGDDSLARQTSPEYSAGFTSGYEQGLRTAATIARALTGGHDVVAEHILAALEPET